jgi:cell division protein FtsW
MNTTYVRPRENPIPRRRLKTHLNFDVPLLMATFILLVFGLVMVYSASWDFSYLLYGDYTFMFKRQVLWLLLGIVVAVVTSLVDYHLYQRFALPGMLITLGGLVVVFMIGEIRHGATRTLSAGSYMPSEAAKIATIIYLSIWLYSKRNVLADISFGLLPLAGIIGLISGLIMAQPDLSAAATIVFLGGILFFLAGGDLKQISFLLVVTVMVGWFVVSIHPTGSARIADFLDGLKDPTQSDYHVLRSIESFVNGGVFGKGIGKANAKLTGLPVPPTDSIFAVIAEETGLLGTTVLIGLYIVVIWRGMLISKRAPDALGSLIAAGLTLWIAMEAFINMGVMVGLLPFAGNALPFISAGGSNLLVSLAAIGMIINISRQGTTTETPPERIVNAPDGMRRSDRRRNQSRSRRAPGIQRG